MPIPRFFVEPEELRPGELQLPPTEAQHAAGSFRLREGDPVELFDGAGRVGTGAILRVARGAVLAGVETVETVPWPAGRLVLATAVPKGKRWPWLVEKATELGVTELQPLHFRHSVAKAEGDPDKWLRWAIEAAKQCRRNRLPDLPTPVSLEQFLAETKAETRWLAAGDGRPGLAAAAAATGGWAVIVGPEAGLTPEETAACETAGFKPVCLGAHILRIETAGLAAAALWAARSEA